MKTHFVALFAIAILFASFSYCRADEKYVVDIPMLEGLETTSLTKHIENLSVLMAKKMNADIKSRQLVYTYGDSLVDLITKEFKQGKADVSYVNGLEYIQYIKAGGRDMIPLFTLAMDRSLMMKECVYVRKNEIANVQELRGKKWAASHLVPMRYLLYQNGIDEPLEKFFSSVDYMIDAPLGKMVERLGSKDIDAFSTYSIIMRISGEENKKDSVVEPLFCDVYDHTWIFVARVDSNPVFIDKLRKIMLNAHKDPDFKPFKFAFDIVNGRFMPIDQAALDKIGKVADIINKKGWKKEQDSFYKKHHKAKK